MPTSPPPPGAEPPFDTIVFSGGGCRCFWQLGFWQSAAPLVDLSPSTVSGVSAGAAMACAALAGEIQSTVENFKRHCAANERNVYPSRALSGGAEPVFPHEQIYRATILGALDDASLERLRSGPELRVLLARAPQRLGARSGLALAISSYVLDRRELRVHARWGKRFGFRPEVVSVKSCRTPGELADLILHSSCSPPLLPLYRRGGEAVLDGGVLDNAPTDLSSEAQSTLVLLSRRYGEAKIPRVPRVRYVQPSRDIPVEKWDYTNPALIQQTYDLGRRDGETWAKSLRVSH